MVFMRTTDRRDHRHARRVLPTSTRRVLPLAHMAGSFPRLVTLFCVLALPPLGQAAVFQCGAGDVACLIAAINDANVNGEENTITLAAGTYTLTAVDNDTDGPNGLPSITSMLTIRGVEAEATIIERVGSAPDFRLMHVAAGSPACRARCFGRTTVSSSWMNCRSPPPRPRGLPLTAR
jgi:hypothetical protein